MDYKKAYEDAIERAKCFYNEHPSSSTAKFVCGQIFPELAESEDERIRKELIDYLSNEMHNVKQLTPRTNEFDAWIAYLEKQNAAFIEYGRQEYYRGRTEAIDEQKPAEFKYRDDEKLFQLIEDVIRVYGKTYGEWIAGVDMDTLVVFLRRLRDKQPAEWNDAERKQLYSDGFNTSRRAIAGTFMDYLDEHRPEGKICLSNGECAQLKEAFKDGDVETIVRYINKYQRPAWKPNEEQICALERAIVKMQTPNDIGILAELRDNLRKL